MGAQQGIHLARIFITPGHRDFRVESDAKYVSQRQVHAYAMGIEIVERHPALQQALFPALFGGIGQQSGTPAAGNECIERRPVARHQGQRHVITTPKPYQ